VEWQSIVVVEHTTKQGVKSSDSFPTSDSIMTRRHDRFKTENASSVPISMVAYIEGVAVGRELLLLPLLLPLLANSPRGWPGLTTAGSTCDRTSMAGCVSPGCY
jgi:hypothetical protein